MDELCDLVYPLLTNIAIRIVRTNIYRSERAPAIRHRHRINAAPVRGQGILRPAVLLTGEYSDLGERLPRLGQRERPIEDQGVDCHGRGGVAIVILCSDGVKCVEGIGSVKKVVVADTVISSGRWGAPGRNSVPRRV